MSLDLTQHRAETTSALATLCSASPDVFSHQIWARRAWLSQAETLPDPGNVFSIAAVDELLSQRGLRTPFLRMAKDGQVIAAKQFSGPGGTGAMIADQVRDEDVLRLFSEGSTIVLQGLHRTWRPVNDLAARLAAELGHPVQVNAYITPPQSQGFAPHYDTHDVFVLQIAGTKQWTVHEPVTALPTAPWDTVADQVAHQARKTPVIATTMRPGDCLYLPRGFIHSAAALAQTSVHLTFGVHAITEADIVAAILAQVQAADWRASMPVGWDPLAAGDAVRALVDAVHARLDAVDITAVGHALHDTRATTQRPEPLSPVTQATAAARLRPGDVVRMRRFLNARLADDALILPGGQRVEVATGDRDAIRTLLSGHAVTVRELTCDMSTITRLLRDGVLVIETDL